VRSEEPLLVRADIDQYRLTVSPDGRAIISGTRTLRSPSRSTRGTWDLRGIMAIYSTSPTSYPKPKQVYRGMEAFVPRAGANPGRGGHRLAARRKE